MIFCASYRVLKMDTCKKHQPSCITQESPKAIPLMC